MSQVKAVKCCKAMFSHFSEASILYEAEILPTVHIRGSQDFY